MQDSVSTVTPRGKKPKKNKPTNLMLGPVDQVTEISEEAIKIAADNQYTDDAVKMFVFHLDEINYCSKN